MRLLGTSLQVGDGLLEAGRGVDKRVPGDEVAVVRRWNRHSESALQRI